MPESSKKRQLVKQFNKQNGQGTPRHIKNNTTSNSGSKSFGDSIKKRIFQKKLLNHKKMSDPKYGCNFSRSSSEENILSNVSIYVSQMNKGMQVIMVEMLEAITNKSY